MSKEYPLFPELSEEGEKEAMRLLNKFMFALSDSAKNLTEDIMGEFYADIIPYIQSDSWLNFRNDMMEGFRDYKNAKVQNEWNFKDIRKQIYNDFKDEINKDLDKDNLLKIQELEKEIAFLRRALNDRRGY